MAGLVATRSFERSPSHLSDTTRLSSDDLDGGGARDDESTRRSTPGPRDERSTEVEEVEDLLASLRVAPYQVAGHSSKGVGLPSLVDIDVGHFLKPAPDDRKGVAELSFYERVARAAASGTGAPAFEDEGGKNVTTSAPPVSHRRDAIAGIAPFVPTFHGVLTVDPSTLVSVAGDDPTAAAARDAASKGTRATFLRLEDVTAVRIFVYLFMLIILWTRMGNSTEQFVFCVTLITGVSKALRHRPQSRPSNVQRTRARQRVRRQAERARQTQRAVRSWI